MIEIVELCKSSEASQHPECDDDQNTDPDSSSDTEVEDETEKEDESEVDTEIVLEEINIPPIFIDFDPQQVFEIARGSSLDV